ncbi:sodium-dependent nutrient amino acid transporter 1-like [Wyeomyia smithii]|uniref:sodium-dependent nutrient amino acid transporter 1-like n=1 Tax=Wyeomyia smithii TaxID=174621 RepID=UPI0024680722|nr:sodium-dependent nutrient amino acid transporter 1-like [Wyeomyia smithii]
MSTLETISHSLENKQLEFVAENHVKNMDCVDNAKAEIKDDQNRPEWSNKIEFLMSCIAMSVGLGNVWRFPFTAYENGGGAFLIPYLVVLFIIGRPLYYLEMILGQFTRRSSIKVWSISPLFKGIGVGQLLGTTSVVSYYMALIAITLSYLFASFASELPWAKCKSTWGPNCVDASNTVNDLVDRNSSLGRSVSSSEIYFLIFPRC